MVLANRHNIQITLQKKLDQPNVFLVHAFDRIAGGKDGIHLTFSRDGRPSGEAFVEFVSDEDLEKALEKHNEHMGHRYIEVFKTKTSEMEWVVGKSAVRSPNGFGTYDIFLCITYSYALTTQRGSTG